MLLSNEQRPNRISPPSPTDFANGDATGPEQIPVAPATIDLDLIPDSNVRRATILIAVIGPFLGTLAAIALLWDRGINAVDLSLMLGLAILTQLGINVGYHRLFTHRAFRTTAPVEFVLASLGSMAAQGPVLQWVATHRRHHEHSDRPHDPHSPHFYGSAVFGVLRGLWHSHLGWMIESTPANMDRYVKDLNRNRVVRVSSALFPFWVLVGFAIPAAIGGLAAGSWEGAFYGALWGGVVRLFLVHHLTWSVNSVCHLWGARPYASNDESRNNAFVGVFALGEGWHNTHHAFPTSARHGLEWWQFDAAWWVIRGLSAVGLAWDVRLPSEQAIQSASRNVSQ